MRKPLQGVCNIIRFNWHFYTIALVIILGLCFIGGYFNTTIQLGIYIFCSIVTVATILSLLASLYVYDLSGFYILNWIATQNLEKTVVNISAGFDETSALLQNKFPTVHIIALDFYDPIQHTEISIKRARKAYPPFPNTKTITTSNLGLDNDFADKIFVTLSAHEIRDVTERNCFFSELQRIVKPTGQIYITEHLRDWPNGIVYNMGFFHFYSKNTWLKEFQEAGLTLKKEVKPNTFMSTFILEKNGNTP
jgi:SAM-dependent methyltransferase